jgi:hypothetical protein
MKEQSSKYRYIRITFIFNLKIDSTKFCFKMAPSGCPLAPFKHFKTICHVDLTKKTKSKIILQKIQSTVTVKTFYTVKSNSISVREICQQCTNN